MNHRVSDRVDAMAGERGFADCQLSGGIVRLDGNMLGVVTRGCPPKPAAFALRQRWTALAGHKNSAKA